jgi:ubiquitin-like protein ATG12
LTPCTAPNRAIMAATTIHGSPSNPAPPLAATDPPDDASPALRALETYKKKDPSKGLDLSLCACYQLICVIPVVVRFKAVGNAPIMKQNFYKITASNRFQAVIQFLRKELGWKPGDPLVSYHYFLPTVFINHNQFTYINLAFSPAPDDTVSNLYKVCVLGPCHPDTTNSCQVLCHRWAFNCKLQVFGSLPSCFGLC